MEKKIKGLNALKWLGFPLGWMMFIFTKSSFGMGISLVLAVLSTVIFWNMVRNEQTRLIGQTIASEIKAAISESCDVENLIEIKRMKSGIIARVYLINAKERVQIAHKAIARRMESCSLKKYLWIMQLTDMPGKSALPETQKLMNEQLLEELTKQHGSRKEKNK